MFGNGPSLLHTGSRDSNSEGGMVEDDRIIESGRGKDDGERNSESPLFVGVIEGNDDGG